MLNLAPISLGQSQPFNGSSIKLDRLPTATSTTYTEAQLTGGMPIKRVTDTGGYKVYYDILGDDSSVENFYGIVNISNPNIFGDNTQHALLEVVIADHVQVNIPVDASTLKALDVVEFDFTQQNFKLASGIVQSTFKRGQHLRLVTGATPTSYNGVTTYMAYATLNY